VPQGLDLIRKLLTPEPSERLGSAKGGAEDVKKHTFYKKLAWQSLLTKKIEAPYKPTIKNAFDTSNFEAFDDPDRDTPYGNVPRGIFDEFTKVAQQLERA
jgi:protein kinase A